MPNKKWIVIVLVIVLSFMGLVWYLGLYGFIMSLLLSLFLLVITNLDKAADVVASSYKWGSKVNFWFEKNAVEKRLESTIGIASKKINEEAGTDLLPHGIDIKWDTPQNRDAFLQRGKVVVCLEPSSNEDRNLARATMMYVEEDLIAEAQRFISISMMKSACFVVSRKMLMLDRKLSALKCLNKEFIEPEVQKKPQITKYVSGMENIDKQGFLTRILLREFMAMDPKLSPALTDTRSRKESKGFARMLKELVEKEKDAQVPLTFKGLRFRVSIMPVAKLDRSFNIENFVKSASYDFRDDVETIYVVARGANTAIAKLVVSEIEKTKMYLKNIEWEYKMFSEKRMGQVQHYVGEMVRVPSALPEGSKATAV
jgi:hypothetical protein